MLDFSHLPESAGTINTDVQLYVGHSYTAAGQWNTWIKPRGANMVYIYAMGGGSAGTDGVVTTGGQGGGSGAMAQILIPAMMIPDVLYIYSGQGGRGGAGAAGQASYVCIEQPTTSGLNPTLQIATVLLTANGASAGAGGFGSVTPITMMPLAGRGIWSSISGVAGSTGIATAQSTGIGSVGGSGGGAGNSAGNGSNGAVVNVPTTASGRYLPSSSTIAGGTGAVAGTPATAGSAGQFTNTFWYYGFGGTGGGGASSTAGGTAGKGGDGALGAGGGGGGGGSTTNAAAIGGNGGDGFVYIMSW